MWRLLRSLVVLAAVTSTAAAQNADLALKLAPDAQYNAGSIATVKATITNSGPETAPAPAIRLTKPVDRFVSGEFGCIDFRDSMLCPAGPLKAGESRDVSVPFPVSFDAGAMLLTARIESPGFDPNPANDSATASANVVRMADLSVRISTSLSLRTQKASAIWVSVDNHAAVLPKDITVNVTFPEPLTVTSAGEACVQIDGTSYRCTMTYPTVAMFIASPSRSGPPVKISASVESSEPDWNPSDNRAEIVETIWDVPDLDLRMNSSRDLDENNRATLSLALTNATDMPANFVSVEISTFQGTPELPSSGEWRCSTSSIPSYRVVCSNRLIASHATSTLSVPIRFPARYLRTQLNVSVTQNPGIDFRGNAQLSQIDAVFYRPFTVTNTEDGGDGSLRQAIVDANAICSGDDANPPCEIRFAIPASGWVTIAPRSPLPLITVSDFSIEGETQTASIGDSNPAGPEVFLLGSDAGDANGLEIYSSAAVVRGLAIGGFAQNAILSMTHHLARGVRHQTIERNFLGLDPTGTQAVPNGLRGIMAYRFDGEITSNVISANQRSGIFLVDSSNATISDNRIGVAANSDASFGNGASGIFIGRASTARIRNNVIANGPAFGIAIDSSTTAEIFENTIYRNGQPGIDIGLDGPTVNDAPVITSAHFDAAAGETIIEGFMPRPLGAYRFTLTAYVYANSEDAAEGELFLGTAVGDKNGRFVLRYPGDLTGRYVDAMKHEILDFGDWIQRHSSEFGPRTRVETVESSSVVTR